MRPLVQASTSGTSNFAMQHFFIFILIFIFLYYTGKLQKEMTTSYSERHVAKASGRPLSKEQGMIRKHKMVGDGQKVQDHLSLGDYRDGLEKATPRNIELLQLQALNLG